MKPPYYIGAVCIAMALAACSGAQSGSIANTSVAGAQRATTALILVANENTGLGGSIREYAESANGNVAPSTVISHINGPYAVAFSSTEGIGIANGNIASGGQAAAETFGLAGDFLTGISCFPNPVRRAPWRSIPGASSSLPRSYLRAAAPSKYSRPEQTAALNQGVPSPTQAVWPSTATTFSTWRIRRRQRSISFRRDPPPCRGRSAEATLDWEFPARAPCLPTRSRSTLRSTSTSSMLRLLRSASSPPERMATSRQSAPFPVRTPD